MHEGGFILPTVLRRGFILPTVLRRGFILPTVLRRGFFLPPPVLGRGLLPRKPERLLLLLVGGDALYRSETRPRR